MWGRKTRQPAQRDAVFADIHCHLLHGIDDGAKSEEESLLMAEMAAHDGTRTVIVTPHQLGSFAHNTGELIRRRTREYQQLLDDRGVALTVLPGADVRIEPGLVDMIRSGNVLTLGDHGLHVLLELPHELYVPLERLIDDLHAAGLRGILSHPERNQGLLRQPEFIGPLVEAGCLMQITAGSLLGTFGPASQDMSEWMLHEGLVHFVATDAHGIRSRRPLMRRAYSRVAELAGTDVAMAVCCDNPVAVADGRDIATAQGGGRRAA